jgi:hypothetical protein
MGSTYGRTRIGDTGYPIQVSADGNPIWRTGGITIDWSTVAAAAADTPLTDLVVIKTGQKGLRFGQVLVKKGGLEVQTVTITGTPTGGTFTLTFDGQTTGALPYNATAAQVRAALNLLTSVGPAGVTVTGGPLPGAAVTVTFNGSGDKPQMTASATGLTGGTTPAVAIATTTVGTATGGMYGPYDPAAGDGRQTIGRNNTVILNESLLENGFLGFASSATNHPGVIEGGKVWRDRLLATTGTASLAAGPTFADLEAALPQLTYAQS